ncbi:MAG: hypothetical protein DRR08_04770 [Candidatus Parabeggiatoa sp. nov. 2]|nr:MAG: hypothetical protein B6247_24465 [Beggiatoa sp. 4572_84]RKZ62899.1 MAG: hypothetical protein DRR08_04770 [Gammaproteobacteria bacterium]
MGLSWGDAPGYINVAPLGLSWGDAPGYINIADFLGLSCGYINVAPLGLSWGGAPGYINVAPLGLSGAVPQAILMSPRWGFLQK